MSTAKLILSNEFIDGSTFNTFYRYETDFDLNEYNSYLKYFTLYLSEYIYAESIDELYKKTSKVIIPSDSFSINYECTENNGHSASGSFIRNENSKDFSFTTNFDVESISNLKIKLFIADDMGNSAALNYTIPGPDDFFATVTKTDGKAQYRFYSAEGGRVSNGIKISNDKAVFYSLYYDENFDVFPTEEFYLSFQTLTGYTEMTKVPYIYDVQTSALDDLEMDSPQYTLSRGQIDKNGGPSTDLHLHIANSAEYDKVKFVVTIPHSYGDSIYEYMFDSNSEIIIPIKTSDFFGTSITVTMQGAKGFGVSNPLDLTIPKITDFELDNHLPYFTYSKGYESITVEASDGHSGVKRIMATILNSGKTFEKESDTFDIPILDNYDSYINIKFEYSGNIYTCPVYFYTGSPSSGRYDFIWPDGISKSSVAISSDPPVI